MLLLGKIGLGMAGVALAGAGVLCSEGFVQVNVVEKQPHGASIHIIAPAMLAPIAVRLAPSRAFEEAAGQIQPQLPVIDAALDGLRESEDMVIVQVDTPGEHMQVAKSGGSIIVDVDDPAAIVHVSAPIRAVSSTIDQLAAASPEANPL
ncbi:MAG: hypothetical protein KGL02_00850 [Acidobacteriota bacterium]|nr:hypothetical protein [Acidobacteriota bacterium]